MRPRSSLHKGIAASKLAASSLASGTAQPSDEGALTRADAPLTSPTTQLPASTAETRFHQWFADQDWEVFPFQQEAWARYLEGSSGLISVPTGSGKTYAAIGGPMIQWLDDPQDELFLIYVSPLRALARDLVKSIQRPIQDLGLDLTVGLRSSDTTAKARGQMKEKLPPILVITPESLELLMTEPQWKARLKKLRAVVIDEWHELLGSKRGTMLELSLARLRHHCPNLRTWTVSATIGNLAQAAQVGVGADTTPVVIAPTVEATSSRSVAIKTLLPASPAAFHWLGRSGIKLIGTVIDSIDLAESTLIFTNTRSQAELWYRSILESKPEWAQILALHHGSLSAKEREQVEADVKTGDLKVVVATSSLDLGVDFPQVKKVIQIGSAKSFARAAQRAGRAFHSPGKSTALHLLPTQLLEIFEAQALRDGFDRQQIESIVESRIPLHAPLDVLVQFILNSAYGEGFDADELRRIVKSSDSYRDLRDADYTWALQFVTTGGYSLSAYPQFRKLKLKDGRYVFSDRRIALQHKINMGTITSGQSVQVKFPRGGSIGSIDENFVAKLKTGDTFYFAGKTLRLLQLRDMTAFVRLAPPAKKLKDVTLPVWTGTTLPMSSSLSKGLRSELHSLSPGPEARILEPLIRQQEQISHLPRPDELLVEQWRSNEGYHLYVFPFEGRLVHEGLGHLVAFRLARLKRNTFSVSANDYGFELLSTEVAGSFDEMQKALCDHDSLNEDIVQSLNYPELARSAFREIARVAGLVFQGYPGKKKTARHLQMSSSLLFDVFKKYEPEHPLFRQAFAEVRERQLQIHRLRETMDRAGLSKWVFKETPQISPLAWPLYLERMKTTLSTEKLEDRIARLQRKWELAPP